ncbi:MAG: hypothetical protein M0O95_06610 [Clostridiales bacterium]|jgi:hypothetical protein|nr:hypothetical protein [Clostridiales bacterium]MCK9349817.1 hypothetical protein [Clostridiales bacterium]MDD2571813.1 hypothetical protein [Eubacteriales bacterium]MDD3540755.1 hypothetical protein [Eubacteriales bacterium]MDD4186615.1 hypothetical protein [Eubacteriales bacterium]
MSQYEKKIHRWGRISGILAFIMFTAYPLLLSLYFNAWPYLDALGKGLLGVVPIFYTVGVIEAFTYGPMLGAGGSYLSFVTGNITNLKAPCAINAMKVAKVEPGTPEGEAISTLSIGISSIVTTIILFLGMLLLSTLAPILESPLLAPAFANILPALFGGLAVVFVSRNWKIAVGPMVFMLILFIVQPGLASAVSLLVPVGAVLAIVLSRILYKRGKL